MANSRSITKKQTYEEITDEIRALRILIKEYQDGNTMILGSYSYPAALRRLMYLRRRQTQIKPKSISK